MSADLQTLQNAFAVYQQGDLDTARAMLEPIHHPQAWHILGLIERRAGHFDRAADYLLQAARADPHNHEIANNQGRVARDAGLATAAEAHFRRALHLRPGWSTALEGLARSLNDQKRWRDALEIWQTVSGQDPASIPIAYGTAMAELETGAVEAALARYDQLISQGAQDPAIAFMRGRARLETGNVSGGLTDLQTAWAAAPSSHVLRNLANTLWMLGDKAAFEALLASVPPSLVILGIILRHEAGQTAEAIAIWDALPETERSTAAANIARARLAKDIGDSEIAARMAEQALRLEPDNSAAIDAAICGRLMQNNVDAAMVLIRQQRARNPLDQHWLAHETTALRMLGDARYHQLVQVEAHIRTYTLPIPPGYATIEAFNTALAAAIEPVRSFTSHPLDQSFKLGAQTSRDLATTPDPVIEAYIRALDQPIRQYLQDIGNAPNHPLTERNTGAYTFNGCWSVKLGGGGRHVNHVHPQGWISSAYYISVPEQTDTCDKRAGWIKFGQPPLATPIPLPPEKWVRPEAGQLVLFPSYMWHGTEPISAGAVRITAPFDLLPA